MPSKAYGTFKYNLVDVTRLVGVYEKLAPPGQGRRHLGHITRSAIVTLCACWENYAEDLINEGVGHIRDSAENPDDLPKQVRKVISHKVKNAIHELQPLKLAGEGWKDLYVAYAMMDSLEMHSPKAENIQALMKNYLGVKDSVYDVWSYGKDELDEFVGLRNLVAHKGRKIGRYIWSQDVRYYIGLVHCTVKETDNFVREFLREYLGRSPWNRIKID